MSLCIASGCHLFVGLQLTVPFMMLGHCRFGANCHNAHPAIDRSPEVMSSGFILICNGSLPSLYKCLHFSFPDLTEIQSHENATNDSVDQPSDSNIVLSGAIDGNIKCESSVNNATSGDQSGSDSPSDSGEESASESEPYDRRNGNSNRSMVLKGITVVSEGL